MEVAVGRRTSRRCKCREDGVSGADVSVVARRWDQFGRSKSSEQTLIRELLSSIGDHCLVNAFQLRVIILFLFLF